MRVNRRGRDQDRPGSLVVRESRPAGPEAFRGRDLAKVAQYEVLGNEAKNKSAPEGR
jgi:hypothetical protein